MANLSKILDGDSLARISKINKKLQEKFGASSNDCMQALLNAGFSSSDIDLCVKIITGCTKCMSQLHKTNSLLELAKSSISRPTKKGEALTDIMNLIVNGRVESFRPANISENLPKYKKDYETVSRVLKKLLANNIVFKESLKSESSKKGKHKMSGPDSQYNTSNYVHDIRRVLSIPLAWRFVLAHLIASGVLTKSFFILILGLLYRLKFAEHDGIRKLKRINSRLRLAEGYSPEDMRYYNFEDLDDIRLKEMSADLTGELLGDALFKVDSIVFYQIVKAALIYPDYNFDYVIARK